MIKDLKGVVFDFDGTLVDSMPVWEELPERFLTKNNIKVPAHVFDVVRNLTISQSAAYFKKEFNLNGSAAQIAAELEDTLRDTYVECVALKPGAEELIKKLSARGVRMSIATAAEEELVAAVLERRSIKQYFEGIMTATKAGRPKTDPLIFFKAIEMLGAPPQDAVIVEDALYAIETAKKAGLTVVGVYDRISAAQQPEIKKLADYYIESLTQFPLPL